MFANKHFLYLLVSLAIKHFNKNLFLCFKKMNEPLKRGKEKCQYLKDLKCFDRQFCKLFKIAYRKWKKGNNLTNLLNDKEKKGVNGKLS